MRFGSSLALVLVAGAVGCGSGTGGGASGGTGGAAGTGGAGGLQTGGQGCNSSGPAITSLGSSPGPFTPSLAASTSLGSLSAADQANLCSEIDNYLSASGEAASWRACHYLALLSVTAYDYSDVGGQPAQESAAQSVCQYSYMACTGAPTPTSNGMVGFAVPVGAVSGYDCSEMAAPSGQLFAPCQGHALATIANALPCTATVGDLATCLNDYDSALAAQDAMVATCTDPSIIEDGSDALADMFLLGPPQPPNVPASCVAYSASCSGAFLITNPSTGLPIGMPVSGGSGGTGGATDGGSCVPREISPGLYGCNGTGPVAPGYGADAAADGPPPSGRPTTPTDF